VPLHLVLSANQQPSLGLGETHLLGHRHRADRHRNWQCPMQLQWLEQYEVLHCEYPQIQMYVLLWLKVGFNHIDIGKPVLAMKKRPAAGASSVASLSSMNSSGYHLHVAGRRIITRKSSVAVKSLPATLLQVAESSALRFIKANNNTVNITNRTNSYPNPSLIKGSTASVSRPMSRPTSRPGSDYRPDRDGWLHQDNNTNSSKGDDSKAWLKPNPTTSNVNSNTANKVFPLDSVI